MAKITWKFWLLILLFNPVIAQQGNYKYNNYGNKSIFLAGNVTGSVPDLALMYYNPSFLTEGETTGFSLNAKAFQVSNYKLKDFIEEDSKLNYTTFTGSSNMAGGVFNMFGTRFAYGYISKSNYGTDIDFNYAYLTDNIINSFPGIQDHNSRIGLNSKVRDDWAGFSWAHKINEKFSVGVSLFGSVYGSDIGTSLSHALEYGDSNVTFYLREAKYEIQSYGLFMKIGAHYSFPKFDLGLNINLPYLEVYSQGNFFYTEVLSGNDSGRDYFTNNDFKRLSANRKEPLGISIGAGIPLKKSELHINIDYVNGLDNYSIINIPDIETESNEIIPSSLSEERKTIVNFGFGLEHVLSEYLKIYGGFSTDFNAIEDGDNIFEIGSAQNKDISIGRDLYHLSSGVDWNLKWISLIMGLTYTTGANNFLNPYSVDAGNFEINNETEAKIRYSRLQFVIGVDVPLSKKKK